ncbi:ATP-binding protein [Kitasatospora nipponensis]|uniref:ATP-binding protein n=1 Tax=Kitasatospora nipponensis TaxID=258049 RepID=A0ABN1W234_9ACTN
MSDSLDRPTDPSGVDHIWLPCSRRSPGLARRRLREFLARVEGGGRFAEVGELLVSELVTNAWRHGTRTGRLIRVGFGFDADRLVIEVDDAGGGKPELGEAAADQESGRGLRLVDGLALAWGCGARPGVGKRVWAVVGPAAGEGTEEAA